MERNYTYKGHKIKITWSSFDNYKNIQIYGAHGLLFQNNLKELEDCEIWAMSYIDRLFEKVNSISFI